MLIALEIRASMQSLFRLVAAACQILQLQIVQISPAKLVVAHPQDCFVAVLKGSFLNGKRQVGMLLYDAPAVVSIDDGVIPDDQGVTHTAFFQNIGFELCKLGICKRRDNALELCIND